MVLIKVILGSTRPNRFGIQPAEWLMKLAKEHPEATYELIDLRDHSLPLLDEPQPPAMGNYANKHTQAWAKVIGEADGFVFITPEYNYATSAELKNAIDFLGTEWRYKPVAFVGYGVDGGVRAVANLRVIAGNLSMYSLRDEVSFSNYWAQLDDQGRLVPNKGQVEKAHKLLKNIAFWAEKMKAARKELKK